eukprot:6212242-Pleurochrysis_carterae.AAC.1
MQQEGAVGANAQNEGANEGARVEKWAISATERTNPFGWRLLGLACLFCCLDIQQFYYMCRYYTDGLTVQIGLHVWRHTHMNQHHQQIVNQIIRLKFRILYTEDAPPNNRIYSGMSARIFTLINLSHTHRQTHTHWRHQTRSTVQTYFQREEGRGRGPRPADATRGPNVARLAVSHMEAYVQYSAVISERGTWRGELTLPKTTLICFLLRRKEY